MSAGWRDFPAPCSLCASKTTGFTPWSFINSRTFIPVPSPGGDYFWLGSSNRNPAEPEAARPSERERTSPRQDEGGRQNKHEQPAWSANTDLFHRYVFCGTALNLKTGIGFSGSGARLCEPQQRCATKISKFFLTIVTRCCWGQRPALHP